MEYNPNSFFDDMLNCFNRVDSPRLSKQEKINALMDAYNLLRDMDSKWETISKGDRGKAIFYWRVYVLPEAEKYRIKLDCEPKFTGI